VIDYYLGQAELEKDNKEAYGLALEAASDVLEEAQQTEEAKAHLERALEMYVELAEEFAASDTLDESSRLYSKAADCAKKLGDDEKSISYYEVASVKAEETANSFMEMDVKELATIWLRTAGMEALKTGKEDLLDKAIGLLRDSADGFKSIDEMSDAFEDLFAVFEALFLHRSDSREEIGKVLDEMDELARTAQEYKMHSLMTVINSLEKGSPTAALLALQEREEELLPLRERLLTLVKQSKLVRAPEDFETTGRTHWLYK
jgi:tetratricopeptide (TPR) repeat protein